MDGWVFFSSLFFVVLFSPSSSRNGGVKAEKTWIWQTQGPVSVIIGEVLRLECKVPDKLPAGAVKWYLGEIPTRKLVYAQTDENDERITRNSPSSNTDFAISIRNVTLEDAGTYYCVKEKKGTSGTKDWLHGPGTRVIVKAFRDHSIIPIAAGVSGFILVCLFCVALYFYLKKKIDLRNSKARTDIPFPEKQPPSKQTFGDKEIVYADLKDPRGLQIARKIDSKEHSEYATIKGAPSGAADKGTFHSLSL